MRIVALRPELGVRERGGQLHVRLFGRLRGDGQGRRRMYGRQRVRAAVRSLRHQCQVHKHCRVVHLRVPARVHRVGD